MIAAAAVVLGSCATTSPVDKESVLASLNSYVEDGKVLYGHQDDPCYGHSWRAEIDGELDRSDVKDVCGDKPAVVGFDLGGIEHGSPLNIDGVPFDLIRRAAVKHFEEGGIVTLSWHVDNPLTGGDSWDVSSSEVVRSVLNGQCHGRMMQWLERCADFIETLVTEDGTPIPVIFRPWHEHTGSWFWWGWDLCTRGEYVELWTLTYDYLVEERGLDQLIWAYSPGGGITPRTYMRKYPGDEKVDILAFDCYQWGDRESYISEMRDELRFLTEIGRQHNKPIAVAETGYEGIPDPKWWTEALLPAIEGYPVTYVLTWRNACDKPGHYYAPWPGSADEDNFREFYKTEKTVFLTDLK